MRRVFTSCMAAGLLVMPTAGTVMAQDEDLRMGDDPAYYQRVEVPDAGVAISLPETWDVATPMEYDLVDPADPDSGSWRVLYATGYEDGWCSLHRYLEWGPINDAGMWAISLANAYREELGDAATVEWQYVDLPIGDAYRLDVHEPTADIYTSMFLADHAGARYQLVCGSAVRGEHDWMDVAETLEWLPVDGIVDPPGAEPLDEPQLEPADPADSGERRIEVPHAGISLTVPDGWAYEPTMETGEYQLPSEFGDGSTVPLVRVASMDHQGLSWFGTCAIATFEDMPMSPERHAQELGTRLSGPDPSTPPVTTLVELPIGDAARVDFEFIATAYPSVGWTFDVDGLRIMLDCWAERDEKPAFESIVESIEPLDGAPVDEPETSDPSEPSLDDRRVAIPEFDLALTIPAFWTYEIHMEDDEYALPDAFGDGATVPQTHILTAFPFTDGLCNVRAYEDMPLDLESHAREHGWGNYSPSVSESLPEVTPVQLPTGEAYRVHYESLFGHTIAYAFDVEETRYLVFCMGGSDGGSGARTIAASMAPLGEEVSDLGLQRLELTEAGIALSLPTDWEVLPEMEFIDTFTISGQPDAPESDLWRVMGSNPVEDAWCDLFMLSNIPLSLQDHGDVFVKIAMTDYDPPRQAETEAVALPIGDAVRVVVTAEEGTVTTVYLFDVGSYREYLMCASEELPDDTWLSFAESIEPLSDTLLAAEPDFPEGAIAWWEVGPFASQYPVLDPSLEASLIAVWCDRALWFEMADGTFQERDECVLTQEAVEPPEAQAPWPTEAVTLTGGECEWTSDHWLIDDGSDVWATSWSVTVDPDGPVIATSIYAADELDCSD